MQHPLAPPATSSVPSRIPGCCVLVDALPRSPALPRPLLQMLVHVTGHVKGNKAQGNTAEEEAAAAPSRRLSGRLPVRASSPAHLRGRLERARIPAVPVRVQLSPYRADLAAWPAHSYRRGPVRRRGCCTAIGEHRLG